MKRFVLVCSILTLSLGSLFSACGPPQVCVPNSTQPCMCITLHGSQTCNADGSGYTVCVCGQGGVEPTQKEAVSGETGTNQEATTNPDAATELAPEPTTPDEPAAVAEEAPTIGDEPAAVADEPATGDSPLAEVPPEPVSCTSDEFEYKNKCHKFSDFCEGKIQEPGFPAFTQDDQVAMQQPYKVEFDTITKKPLFCQTKDGYYYLPGTGYGECDKDKDGWINIEAYRAVTSTDSKTQANARCTLNKFEHIVYHAEGQQPQVQKLDNPASMVETFRNDGGEKVIERPIYSKDQAALPKSTSSACTADTDCTDAVCYLGHCLPGRRFEPAEINTLTKGCIAGLDLNDNKLDDANESPGDTPDPASEFKPLLTAGYFIELHHGHFQKDYDNNGTQIPVYHIYERPRNKTPGQQGLPLQCEQTTDAFLPDYWKRCQLKDNQTCQDPNDPTKNKPGLTRCWLKDTQRLIPSLFKCTVFDNAPDKTKVEGYFHPDNHGFSNNYNRTVCNFKAKLNESDPTKRDIEFECTADDGSRKPDPTKKEVGWACISYKAYTAPANYLGGCVDQKAEKSCGDKKDGETVTYVTNEKDSYGYSRAYAPCGLSNGKGECDKAWRVCTGGTWLDCDKCDNCPQDTAGQKATCPGGTWPANSCKRLVGPTPEVCDGKDNDCDGQIDNGLVTTKYYKDEDKDTYGTGPAVERCPAQKPAGYATRAGDCNDKVAAIKPGVSDICDGIDNDCDGTVDENATFYNYYKDDDNDGYGQNTSQYIHRGCVKSGDTSKICKSLNNCISLRYTVNGSTRTYRTSNNDCCDSDANAKPGQTKYFSSTNGCGNWNYDCNNVTNYGTANTTTAINRCSCTKSSGYYEFGTSNCDFGGWADWYDDTSCENGCTETTGMNNCQLTRTHTFQPTGDYSRNRQCFTDNHNFTCSKSNINLSWTPKGSDSQNLVIMAKTSYANGGCAILLNGNLPGCGTTAKFATTSMDEGAPSYCSPGNNGSCASWVKHQSWNNICSGSQPCWTSTWNKKCEYQWKVNYSTNYYYFKQTALQDKVIGCR